MDHGRIIALGTPDALKRREVDSSRLEFDIVGNVVPDLKAIPGVIRYSLNKEKLVVHVADTGTAAVKLLDYLRSSNVTVRSMHVKEATLEDVFIKMTGRELRE
jgi:ABC-2 type transport system ATP-binding protein